MIHVDEGPHPDEPCQIPSEKMNVFNIRAVKAATKLSILSAVPREQLYFDDRKSLLAFGSHLLKFCWQSHSGKLLRRTRFGDVSSSLE